jgi:LEA14-like dessication related protein
MKIPPLSCVFILFACGILIAGCSGAPLKKPTVTVSDLSLSEVSLRTMTVNTTVLIDNPNPVGARLNRLAFDVWYVDDTGHYLGHGEKSGIDVKESGNTTVTIPVKIGTIPALQAMGSLVRDGSVTIRVNGSASVDLKLTSYELPFEESREFRSSQFAQLVPVTSLAGTPINVTEKIDQARGILNALKG